MMMVARHCRRRLLILSVSTVGFFISSFSVVLASDFIGPVVSVLDGDTIEVSRSHRNIRIRLNGIDAPEKDQAYGHKSGEFVVLQAFGKDVTVQKYGLDKYGRTLGDVFLLDGTNVNQELVKQGWCWITLLNRPIDRHAVLTGVNGGQRDFSRPAETVHG